MLLCTEDMATAALDVKHQILTQYLSTGTKEISNLRTKYLQNMKQESYQYHATDFCVKRWTELSFSLFSCTRWWQIINTANNSW